MILYFAILIALFIIELGYFKVADEYNIIDKPNQRSSHSIITLRGGGVIYPLSVFLFYFAFGLQYSFFMAGLFAVSLISFADDVKHQNTALRLLIQSVAVGLLLFQIGCFSMPWYWWASAFVLITGIINAYNFMDGINGITACFSFTVLAGVYFVNRDLELIDNNLLICLTFGNVVFTFFNFRKKAKCFAGDVGSVSMAFTLLFFTTWLVYTTGNLIFILFFALYGIDTVLTIIHRLYKGEKIYEAHRQHLFQYLANECRLPQLLVSSLYMVIQGAITAGVLLVWKKDSSVQWMYALGVLGVLMIVYIIIKYRILAGLNSSHRLVSEQVKN